MIQILWRFGVPLARFGFLESRSLHERSSPRMLQQSRGKRERPPVAWDGVRFAGRNLRCHDIPSERRSIVLPGAENVLRDSANEKPKSQFKPIEIVTIFGTILSLGHLRNVRKVSPKCPAEKCLRHIGRKLHLGG